MGVSTVHHEDGRADFVDVVEETAVGVGLRADDAPAVVRVAGALVIAARGLVLVVVVVHEVGRLWGNGVQHTSSHRVGVGEALL